MNPLSAMMIDQDATELLSRSSNCPIKGDFLPGIIYSSDQKTRGGNEDVILKDGSFINFYDDVLADRENWQHETEIEVPAKSLLQVTLIGEDITKYSLLLTAGFNVEQDSLRNSIAHTSAGEIAELTVVWMLEPYRVYHFRVKHRGLYDEQCNYFDLALSVTTISYLKAQHTCLPNYPRLLEILPPRLT